MQLSPAQLQQLQNKLDLATQKAAAALHTMLHEAVEFAQPEICVTPHHADLQNLPRLAASGSLYTVSLSFQSYLSGIAVLTLPPDSTERLLQALAARRKMNFAEMAMRFAVISEVGNILLSIVLGTLANEWQRKLVYTSTPLYREDSLLQVLHAHLDDPAALSVLASTDLQVPALQIQGSMVFLLR